MYYAKYNSLLDTLRMSDSLDIEDPVVAANYLINKLPDKWHYYTSTTPYSFGHIGPEYVQYLSGTCREVTDFAVYLFGHWEFLVLLILFLYVAMLMLGIFGW